MSKQRKEEKQEGVLDLVIIIEIEIQLSEDNLGALLGLQRNNAVRKGRKRREIEESRIRGEEKGRRRKEPKRGSYSKIGGSKGKSQERHKENSSLPIAPIKFQKATKKAQEKDKKVKFGLLKIKVKGQGFKALAEEKKENKLREQRELLNKVEQVALSTEKGKTRKKTTEKYCKEFEKEMEKEEEKVEPSKKTNVVIKIKDLEN